MPRDLHELSRLEDSLSYLYVDKAVVERDENSIVLIRVNERIPVPVSSLTVLVLEHVSPGFRGEITQWLLEVRAGVYVGNISAAVRSRLWEKVKRDAVDGSALIIYSAQTEQGFQMDVWHTPERSVVDMEGIYLIKRETGKK